MKVMRKIFAQCMYNINNHILAFRLLSSDSDHRPTRKDEDTMYEDDPAIASGKTQVTILNQEQDGIYMSAYSSMGFRLADGMRVVGPCAVFPRSILHWNVSIFNCPYNFIEAHYTG